MAKRKDADSPWKQILRGYLPDAIDFFFPDISRLINWQIPPIFLDKELEQLNPDDEIGKRYADQLVEIRFNSGEAAILLLHIEVQASKDKNFEERMLIYAIRIYSRFKQLPCSLAILCDFNESWRPSEHCLTSPGSRIDFSFTATKLMDYQEQVKPLSGKIGSFCLCKGCMRKATMAIRSRIYLDLLTGAWYCQTR